MASLLALVLQLLRYNNKNVYKQTNNLSLKRFNIQNRMVISSSIKNRPVIVAVRCFLLHYCRMSLFFLLLVPHVSLAFQSTSIRSGSITTNIFAQCNNNWIQQQQQQQQHQQQLQQNPQFVRRHQQNVVSMSRSTTVVSSTKRVTRNVISTTFLRSTIDTSLSSSKTTPAPTSSSPSKNTTPDSSSTKSTSNIDSNSNSNSNSNTNTNTNSNNNKRQMIGNFEEMNGNFVLRPPSGQQPRALIHFLGGALVGASPHISYRYLLERLAQSGYLIVATPYNLSFDHLRTCDEILYRFEKIAVPLARAYGALPVVGIGHSLGSLLQVLITSLFPDTPRAANALLSFNNKPVSEAIPLFDEFFAPFFTYVSARNATDRNSGSEIILTGLELAKSAVIGEIPSDELLTKATRLVLLPPPGLTPRGINLPPLIIPGAVRTAFTTFTSPYTMAVTEAGIAPLVSEIIEVLEQIPYLIDEVADGARDFVPAPALVKMATRRSYRARRTLVVQYTEDPIDESDDIEDVLKAASQVIRMKRPLMTGPTIDVQRRNLPGGHAAPLVAPPLDVAEQLESLLGQDTAKERLLYTQADQTVDVLVRWLDESNL